MGKTLFIGDIHGHNDWEPIVTEAIDNKLVEKIVFLGDYLDSFTESSVVQLHNLKNIIALKTQEPEMVSLLLGNHEYSYLFDKHGSSGFQPAHFFIYKKILTQNINLFQIAEGFTHSKSGTYTLVTHGGLTYSWWKQVVVKDFNNEKSMLNKLFKNPIAKPLHEILNTYRDSTKLWMHTSIRGGFDKTPSPLWAHDTEVFNDPFPSINQIFGHTAKITPRMQMNRDTDKYLLCLDSIEISGTQTMIIHV